MTDILKTDEPLLQDQQCDYVEHYGTPRHSGRYPWGSGEDPYQSANNFNEHVNRLKQAGIPMKDIAKQMDMSLRDLRARISNNDNLMRDDKQRKAVKLYDKGYSKTAIAKALNVSEGSVRNMLNPEKQRRANATAELVKQLEKELEEKDYIDLSSGCQARLNVTRTKLDYAMAMLKDKGYQIHKIPQAMGGKGTTTQINVLAKGDKDPKEKWKQIVQNKDKISLPGNFHVDDNDHVVSDMRPPRLISENRLQVLYDEDGGTKRDGLIEIRRGCEDLYMGNAKYAQVRIMIDHDMDAAGHKGYLKGMCTYADDLPDGIDIRFNSNKHKADGLSKALKTAEDAKSGWMKDADIDDESGNPFGATVRQIDNPSSGKLSAINIVNAEGDWSKWNKQIASQVLSKQPKAIAQRQLKLDADIREAQFKSILEITNPAVKQNLLASFAEDCDSAAVHLKAKGMPGQASHVILPFPNMKENEIYAPNYNDGDKVILIRYPHGGIFEIPELKVNNKGNPEVGKVLKGARDAVGISPKVAEKLSGADFDGDTVLVIPNNDNKFKTGAALEGLKNFDTKQYGPPRDPVTGKLDESKIQYKLMTKEERGIQMGKITNLICDMQVRGATVEANADEIARAVRHSMVVIDAYKHKLDYQKSYQENGIAQLKQKYQGGAQKGASTLFSRAKSDYYVPSRREIHWDPETGQKRYTATNQMKNKPVYDKVNRIDPNTGLPMRDSKGNLIKDKVQRVDQNGYKVYSKTPAQQKSTKMYEAKDAGELSSHTDIQEVYVNYANRMKQMGNQARLQMDKITRIPVSASAKQIYAKEIQEIEAALKIAKSNQPLERQAQIYCELRLRQAKKNNPDLWKDKQTVKKLRNYWTKAARARFGSGKELIDITPRRWEAMNSGAFSHSKLLQILKNCDSAKVREFATPRTKTGIPEAKLQRARRMQKGNYSNKQIADALGVSLSALDRALYSEQ